MSQQKSLNASYNFAISQLFGPSLLKKIQNQSYELDIQNLLYSCGLYPRDEDWNFIKGLEISYTYLKRNYRCEYVYKNEIANQLLLKYHSDNSATLLKEVASDVSIADIVIVNGETVAYEIKTELDSFDRLPMQVESYRSIYDKVYIVTHSGALQSVISKVDDEVGIIILNNRGVLKTVRKARQSPQLFTPIKAVLTLRQSELVTSYQKYVGKLPEMGTALVHMFCYKWFLSLEQEDARIVFNESLKSRKPLSHQFELIKQCHSSLRILFLGKYFSKKYCNNISEFLSTFG